MKRLALIEARRAFAELLGTFSLTFVAAGTAVIAVVSHGVLGASAMAVAPGLVVMTMIYSLGPVSGAHLNPAVTLAFAIRGNFPWHRVPLYWFAQLFGAVLAAILLFEMFGPASGAGLTRPDNSAIQGLVMETVLTFFLITVILATAANDKIVGHNAAIAVGATIILDGLVGVPISGASMNPARSFGPALVVNEFTSFWVYVVGPFVGAILAIGTAWLLRGPGSAHAGEVAMGRSE